MALFPTAANNLNQYPGVHFAGGPPLPSPFAYDQKGNLTSGNLLGTGNWTLTYDPENRLLTANNAGGTVAASYDYDPLGRRTHKSGTGVTEAYYLNDGDDEIVEYDGNKNVLALYVRGPAIDEPIAMVTKDGSGNFTVHKYFHTNRQGSVVAMSDDSGALAEGPYKYDPYGNCFQGSTPCAQLANSVPYKFTGRRLDPETGLYYYRARCYSAVLGRFCQTDPVGYTADLNLYTYVGNDPVGRTDPLGLATTCSGPSDNQLCTTTADTFNAGSSNGKMIQASPTTDQAAISGKGQVAVPSGNQEKVGFVQSDSKGNQSVVPASDTKTSSSATTDTATATVPSNAVAAIHGHIDTKSQGMVDAKKGPGDAQPLTLKHAMPNYTVSKDRLGVHELVNGRLQFRIVQGQMSPEETQAIQQNLDREQQLFQGVP